MATRAATTPTRMRFTRAEYHRMGETGIIPPDARVELLEGEVLRMTPIGPGHSAIVAALDHFFQERGAGRAVCRVQSPMVLDDLSEPEPDILLVRPRADFYRRAHPTVADVLLLIEVSEWSAEHDLGDKMRLYARAGVSEYWVFDLTRDVLIVHRDPAGDRYESVREFDRTGRISPAAFGDLVLEIGDVLPE